MELIYNLVDDLASLFDRKRVVAKNLKLLDLGLRSTVK